MTVLRLALLLAAGFYGGIMLIMYLQQRSLQYHPENKGVTPLDAGLAGVSVETIMTPDGERLAAWHAAAPASRPTILFFQGNAGEIADRAGRFAFYRDQGFGVLFISYRGFGGSSGKISEAGLLTDALAGYDWLISRGMTPGRIAVVGESLGTGVAVQLAAQREVSAVVLEAPYTATVDVAASIYWWLPVRLLMKDQFLSRNHIGKVMAPLLMIHGDTDRLIPVDHARRLFAMANEPKELMIIAGGGHDIIQDPGTWAREIAFLEKTLAAQ